MRIDDLIAEVNSLPVNERVRVVDAVLRGLNPPDADIEQKWAAVAQRRLAELRSRQVRGVPGEEVFTRIWKRFRA